MANVNKFVNTNALGGGDGSTNGAGAGGTNAYSSLNSFIANVTGAAADIYNCKCQGGQDTTQADLDIAGITLSGSLTIEAHPTEADGRYYGAAAISTSNYYINKSGGGYAIRPNEINVTLRALQIIYTGGGGFESAISLNSGKEVGLTVEYCSVRAASARSCIGYNASGGTLTASTNTYRYNLFVGGSTAVLDFAGPLHVSGTYRRDIYNNTVYSSGSIKCLQITGTGGSGTQVFNVKNNIFTNSTAPLSLPSSGAVVTMTTDKNATDAGTSGTTNEITLTSAATALNSPGTTNAADFTLKSDITGVNLSLTSDKQGTAPANPPSIGAYQFASGSGPVSVDPGNVAAAAAVVAPTVILGSLAITPAPAAAAAAVVDPAVLVGGLTIAPAPAAAAAASVDPTVILGSLSLAPTPAAAATDKVDPSVLGSGVTVDAGVAAAACAVVDPTVALGSIVVSPAPASARTDGLLGNVIGGAVVSGLPDAFPGFLADVGRLMRV